ncbi:hypothetical protein L1787_21080 [Acuticoccus sp. M5D2P5]|nr:hypothetical protein [Acuticoccus kalidii]MCF3935887.1 hypothetical protein [Acuticoccus kalidii]
MRTTYDFDAIAVYIYPHEDKVEARTHMISDDHAIDDKPPISPGGVGF